MRSALSLALIVCVVGSAFPAAAHEPLPGPIARALPSEAARLAAGQDVAIAEPGAEPQDTPTHWSRVRTLTPGTDVIVTVKGQQPRQRRSGTADEFHMTVHDRAGQKETIARTEVAEIRLRETHGSVAGAIAGAALGVWVGSSIALHLVYGVRCQPSCAGVQAMVVLSAIGIPVATGIGGYHAFSQSTEHVIYRAP